MDGILSMDEHLERARCERSITYALEMRRDARKALEKIRRKQLFREDHQTFLQYVQAYGFDVLFKDLEDLAAKEKPIPMHFLHQMARFPSELQREAWTLAVGRKPKGQKRPRLASLKACMLEVMNAHPELMGPEIKEYREFCAKIRGKKQP